MPALRGRRFFARGNPTTSSGDWASITAKPLENFVPLDVNTASQDDLDAIDGLKGHGPEIVRYREERGKFTDLRQLDEVPGLSGKVDDATRSALTFG